MASIFAATFPGESPITTTPTVTYRRCIHAAHCDVGGWDLDEWTVRSEERPEVARRGTNVPDDTEWHHGFVDSAGRQHWVYYRKAEMSPGRCSSPVCNRDELSGVQS